MHTDQGLFLAFTPGRLTTGELTTGFFIQNAAGSSEQVEFTGEDEIVASEIVGIGIRDVEVGSLVIERIGVIELFRQIAGKLR